MEQFELLDFSDEILLKIFRDFNDIDLLTMAKVSRRFKTIAKETVKGKYNHESGDKHYKINVHIEDGPNIHWLYGDFLETFGDQIAALEVYVEKQINTNQLLKLINTHCCLVKRVTVSSHAPFPVTKLLHGLGALTYLTLNSSSNCVTCTDFVWAETYYPRLESLCLKSVNYIELDVFKQFLIVNKHLKHLKVLWCRELTWSGFEQFKNYLSGLKSVEYMCDDIEFNGECSEIRMDALESLKITTNYSSTEDVLCAFGRGSKMIRELEVTCVNGDIDDYQTKQAFLHSIRLFDKLTSLRLNEFPVRNSLIKLFMSYLPNLESLHLNNVKLSEITTYTILKVFKNCQRLKKLKLKNNSENFGKETHFGLDFHSEMFKIVQNRGSNFQLKLVDRNNKIIITEEKVFKNGILVYWTGCEASLSRSDVHLFDLNDKLLEKIYDYLDESAQRALYETCNKMKIVMQERIKSQWFTVSDAKTAKDLFKQFGEHITKVAINMTTKNRRQMIRTWKIISESGSKQITEMSLNNVRVNRTSRVPVEFPNLSKLNVKSIVSSKKKIFPLMECPKLAQLEFEVGEISLSLNIRLSLNSQLGISLNNLSKIRLNDFNREIEKILSYLNVDICNRILEFTIENSKLDTEMSVRYTNIAMRFRNLVTLNLAHTMIDRTHFKQLFQSCTKLKCLTLQNDDPYPAEDWEQIVESIRKNCKQLEVIQIYQTDDSEFDEEYLIELHEKIVRSLPNIVFKTIYYEYETGTYRVETYKNMNFQTTQKPY